MKTGGAEIVADAFDGYAPVMKVPYVNTVLARALQASTLALSVTTMAASAPAQPPPTELANLVSTWATVGDFQVTIAAHEIDGSQSQDRHFKYSFLRPEHAKIELFDGPMRGTVAVWNGGDRVVAYKRGMFSAFKRTFDLHDKSVTSLRGNGLPTPDLALTLKCFESKEADVQQAPGPRVAGVETTMLSLQDAKGLHCPGDSEVDQAVTKDVLLVNPATHLVLKRMRFVGDAQVEEWDLSDLRINSGLSTNDFST